MSADVNSTARRVCISHELADRADWTTMRFGRDNEPPSDLRRAVGLHVQAGDLAASVVRGDVSRDALVRLAGDVVAWLEAIDEHAAR